MSNERPPIFQLGDLVRANVSVTELSDSTAVNVGFVGVRKLEEFSVTADEFLAAIQKAEEGEFQSVSVERLKMGPSYIEIGAWLGDQTLALAFMGLGAHLGLWKIITPAIIGIEGDQAASMMGGGFLMISGLEVPA